ncbi:hypothetical protein [Nocardia sp. NPDC049707]
MGHCLRPWIAPSHGGQEQVLATAKALFTQRGDEVQMADVAELALDGLRP